MGLAATVGNRRTASVIFFAASCVVAAVPKWSDGATWVAPAGQTYSWFDALAWSPGVPTAWETNYINNGGAPTVNAGSAAAGTLYLAGFSSSQTGGLIVGGGQVSLSTAYVGYAGYGWVQQAGGAVVANNLEFGSNARGSGNYSLSDGTLLVGSLEYLARGSNTTAQFHQTGGIHSVSQSGSTLYVAYGSNSIANYSLAGGQLASYSLRVAYGSTSSGAIAQTGGQHTTYTLSLAEGFGSLASYSLGATGLLSTTTEYVGHNGTGVFTQTGGTHRVGSATFSSALYIGYQSGAQGSYHLSGDGQLLVTGSAHVGYGTSATGLFTQSGGVHALGSSSLYVGSQSGSSGIYQLGGTGLLTAGNQYVGSTFGGSVTGSGLIQQSGGTNVADSVTLGSNGRYELTGGAVQVKGTFSTAGKVTVGDPANPSSSPSLTAAVLSVSGSGATGPTGATGLFTVQSASASVDVTSTLRVSQGGSLTIKAGTLTAPALTNDGAVTVTGAGSLTGPQGSLASITGTGGITIGAGVSVRAGYVRQGSLTLDGTLRLKHSGSGSSFGDLSVAAGGSLVLADDLAAWNYTGASPAGTLRQYLKSGQNGGDWSGTGISSSAAAGDINRLLAVGYAEASDLGVTVWDGVTVDLTTLLIKVVPYGDADLDGAITNNDYALLDRGIAMGHSGWSRGDFNYDGVVDAADSLIIDRTYSIQQGGTPSPSFLAQRRSQFGDAYVAQLLAAIPEPTSLGAIISLIGGVTARRRSRR